MSLGVVVPLLAGMVGGGWGPVPNVIGGLPLVVVLTIAIVMAVVGPKGPKSLLSVSLLRCDRSPWGS